MNNWWETYPWRMVQTNLREIDPRRLNAQTYVEELKKLHATAVMLNAGGILAGYETKLVDHPKADFAAGDPLKDVVEACHAAGIRVIARTDFSKIRQDVYEAHPEWAYRDAEGDIVCQNGYVSACINGEYQEKVKFDIVREMLTEIPFDGVFFNMGSSPVVTDYYGKIYGPCHCAACQKLWQEDTGTELPKARDFFDPAVRRYMMWLEGKSNAQKERMDAMIKSIRPDIVYTGMDYMRTEAASSVGKPIWPYAAPENIRSMKSVFPKRRVDNACVEFIGSRYRDTAVSPALVKLRHWQSLSESGIVSYFIMGLLEDHKDRSSLASTEEVFAFHEKYEDIYTGMTSAAEVLLLRTGHARMQTPSEKGWITALCQSHVPFDELGIQALVSVEALAGKKTVILPSADRLPDKACEVLDAFVQEGGTLIAEGASGLPAASSGVLDCLGISALREKKSNCMSTTFEVMDAEADVFLRSAHSPVIAPGSVVYLTEKQPGTKEYLRMIPEHPFGPPECCYTLETSSESGISVCEYGDGRAIHIAFEIASFYDTNGHANSLNLMQDVLFSLAGVPDIAPGLTPMAEVTLKNTSRGKLLSLVNESGAFLNSYFDPLPVHDIILCPPFDFTEVETLNGGQVAVSEEQGKKILHLDVLRDYEALLFR